MLAGDTLLLPPEAAVGFPPSVHQASAVRAGRAPAPLLGALGAVACLIAIVLFAAGAWIDGMILLGISLALVTLFVSAVRREPDSQLALLTRATVDRSRSLARLAAISARASSRAALHLVSIRRRRRHLRHELRDRLAPLGEAVCHGDELRAKALKAQVSELERALRATEQEASAAVGGARQKIKHERATSERTQPLSAARAEATTGEDGSSQRRSPECSWRNALLHG